ncbi:MAG: hypothetical protein R3E01_36325 [Pirellulaceae bacterium]
MSYFIVSSEKPTDFNYPKVRLKAHTCIDDQDAFIAAVNEFRLKTLDELIEEKELEKAGPSIIETKRRHLQTDIDAKVKQRAKEVTPNGYRIFTKEGATAYNAKWIYDYLRSLTKSVGVPDSVKAFLGTLEIVSDEDLGLTKTEVNNAYVSGEAKKEDGSPRSSVENSDDIASLPIGNTQKVRPTEAHALPSDEATVEFSRIIPRLDADDDALESDSVARSHGVDPRTNEPTTLTHVPTIDPELSDKGDEATGDQQASSALEHGDQAVSIDSALNAPEDKSVGEPEESRGGKGKVCVNEPCEDGAQEPETVAWLHDVPKDVSDGIAAEDAGKTHADTVVYRENDANRTKSSNSKKIAIVLLAIAASAMLPTLYWAIFRGSDRPIISAKSVSLLRGRLMMAGANEYDQRPMANIEVCLLGGDESLSDKDGYFQIQIPASANYQAGDIVQLCLHSQEWLIQHPLLGRLHLPRDPTEVIELRILPKGSKLFWSHEELEALFAQELISSNSMPLGSRLASPRELLDRLFSRSGYSDDAATLEIDRWVGEVEANSGDTFRQGLAAFIAGDSIRATELFDQDADTDEEKALLSRELAGDARVRQRDFTGALAAYQKAFKLLTDDHPGKHPRTRLCNKMASVEWSLAVRGDAATAFTHLDNAVGTLAPFLLAERMSPPEEAMIRHTLGRVYTEIAIRQIGSDAMDSFGKASEAFNIAYKLYQFVPEQQASVEYDRAYLLVKRAEQEYSNASRQLLESASNACNNALAVYTTDTYEVERAVVQLRHGDAQAELALRSAGETAIRHAQSALNPCLSEASHIFSREQSPEEWAMIEYTRGKAYLALALNGSPAELEKAELAFRNALEVFTPGHLDQQNDLVREHLASALLVQFQLDGSHEALAAALDDFKELDASLSRDSSPFLWAKNKVNFGSALTAQANGEPASAAKELLERARNCYNDALMVWPKKTAPMRWAEANVNLANVSSALGNITPGEPGIVYLRSAKEAYENAITRLDTNSEAISRFNLGETLRTLGIRSDTDRMKTLAYSVECMRAALQTLDNSPYGVVVELGKLRSECELAIVSGSWKEFETSIEAMSEPKLQPAIEMSARPTDLRLFVLLAVGGTMSDQTTEATRAVSVMAGLLEGQTEDLPVSMDFSALRTLLESHSPQTLTSRQEWIRRLLDTSELTSREQMVDRLRKLVTDV